VKNNKTIFGMRRFNLMAPKVRYGVYEWVCHQLSRREGLIALRTNFVAMTINGKSKGIYMLEEVFDKRLIENNRRREGIIIRPTTPLQVHEETRVLTDSTLKKQLALLKLRFDAFVDGELPASKLFDVERLAMFYAMSDLVNGFHGLIPNNMHFYFNPITARLEPIGREWDVHFYRPHNSLVGELKHEFVANYLHRQILADPVIFRRYIAALERMAAPKYLEDFFAYLAPQLKEKLETLYKDYLHYSFNEQYFVAGQKLIVNKMWNYKHYNRLRAYQRASQDGRLELVLKNRGYHWRSSA
jgi:hypothetical protein